MLYLDRKGRKVNANWWRYKYGQDRYRTVRRDEFEDGYVETSWVGVAMEWEERPKVFLTMSVAGPEKKRREHLYWSASEDEALMLHEAAIFDFGKKKVK